MPRISVFLSNNYYARVWFDRLAPEYEKKPVEDGGRLRTRTKKINCPAEIRLYRSIRKIESDRESVASESPRAEYEVGNWYVQSLTCNHNHRIAPDERALKEGPLSQQERQELYDQWQCGISPSQLSEYLQGKKRGHITTQDVVNAVQQQREAYKNGRTDVRVLQDQLEQSGQQWKVRLCSTYARTRFFLQPIITKCACVFAYLLCLCVSCCIGMRLVCVSFVSV